MGTAIEWGSVIALLGVLFKGVQIGGNWIDDKIKARASERQAAHGGCDAKTHESLERIADLIERSEQANAATATNLAQHIVLAAEWHSQTTDFQHRLEEKVNVLTREIYATGVQQALAKRRSLPG